MNSFHIEIIKCPNCGCVQQAKVHHTSPWNTYTHDCNKCAYTIMESEWDEVETVKNE
jgi:phage FluMu protein Com